MTAICARGLALAIDRFKTPVPVDVLRELDRWQLAGREPASVYLAKNLRLIDGLMSDLRSLDVGAAIRLVAEHLFPPAEYMKKKYGVRSRPSMLLAYAPNCHRSPEMVRHRGPDERYRRDHPD